ncbi:hypothetical protein ACFY7H_32945 [Streptomyces sp. NPDC012794]|uniref:hypothetical protein n=1 Tax=Streptomyces sp. NPDC012794 TaxID=3364850 RepID=UPI003679C43F
MERALASLHQFKRLCSLYEHRAGFIRAPRTRLLDHLPAAAPAIIPRRPVKRVAEGRVWAGQDRLPGGFEEQFMRRYAQRIPPVAFHSDVKALVGIGLHADRQWVTGPRGRTEGVPGRPAGIPRSVGTWFDYRWRPRRPPSSSSGVRVAAFIFAEAVYAALLGPPGIGKRPGLPGHLVEPTGAAPLRMQESLLISPDTEATVNAPLPYTDPVTARTATAAMNGLSPQGLAASIVQPTSVFSGAGGTRLGMSNSGYSWNVP